MDLAETKIISADQIKFRSSSLGHLMTDARSKTETVSESAKTHAIDVYVSEVYGRKEEAFSKHMDKGNEREEDSITLVSRITKTFFTKNELRLENEFIRGTPDLFLGESINNATETRDTKTSWSAHTFFRAKNKEMEKLYYWQGMAYMFLTGAKTHTIDYCLVNGTEKAINDEKRQAYYSLQVIDPEMDVAYQERCRQIEINHIFDIESFKKDYPHFDFHNDVEIWQWDIPMEQRHHSITFDRDEVAITKIKDRVTDVRKWMNENLFKAI